MFIDIIIGLNVKWTGLWVCPILSQSKAHVYFCITLLLFPLMHFTFIFMFCTHLCKLALNYILEEAGVEINKNDFFLGAGPAHGFGCVCFLHWEWHRET